MKSLVKYEMTEDILKVLKEYRESVFDVLENPEEYCKIKWFWVKIKIFNLNIPLYKKWKYSEIKREPLGITITKMYNVDKVVAIDSDVSTECMRIAKTSVPGDILYLTLEQKNLIHNIKNDKK